ncbi:LssY C-terminal domain-containing protein [Dermabacteraceae bacterium P13095]
MPQQQSLTDAQYPLPTKQPVYRADGKPHRPSKGRIYSLLDSAFAAAGLLLTFWFAWIVLLSGLTLAWHSVVLLIMFWAVLAYLALPRMHQLFTTLYLPDYFISRTKTGDGLLGDPVNLALLGTEEDIHAAMHRAGWVKADPITLRSSLGIIVSSLTGKSYKAAPVSSLYLFGNQQAFAYQQEVDGSAAQRHHVRFWRVPEGWRLPGGERVEWLAAGSYDASVGLSTLTLQVTHKIDDDIDAERDYIIETVRYADPACRIEVIENFSPAFHARNGGGDTVFTDGNMPILNVAGAAQRARDAGADITQADSSPIRIPGKALDHEVPPSSLNWVGLFLATQTLLTALTGSNLWLEHSNLKDAEIVLIALTLTGSALVLALQILLLLLTLKRFRWARLTLLVITGLSAFTQLTILSATEAIPFTSLLDGGTSVLVVLAMSAPSVRQWVNRKTSGKPA